MTPMDKYMTVGAFDDPEDVKKAILKLRELLFNQLAVAALDEGIRKDIGVDAVTADLITLMTDWGVPAKDIAYFESQYREGKILLTVKAAVGLAAAESILRGCNGRTGSAIG